MCTCARDLSKKIFLRVSVLASLDKMPLKTKTKQKKHISIDNKILPCWYRTCLIFMEIDSKLNYGDLCAGRDALSNGTLSYHCNVNANSRSNAHRCRVGSVLIHTHTHYTPISRGVQVLAAGWISMSTWVYTLSLIESSSSTPINLYRYVR